MRLSNLFLLCLLLLGQGVFAQKNAPLCVASYNLRYNTPNDGINAWPNRKEMVKGLIRYHEFDIFGTQEVLRDQLNDLAEMKEFASSAKVVTMGKKLANIRIFSTKKTVSRCFSRAISG